MFILLVSEKDFDIAPTDLRRPERREPASGADGPFLLVELRRWFPDVVIDAVEVEAVDVAREVDVEEADLYILLVLVSVFPGYKQRTGMSME
jgi:hypothetical protein